MERTCRICGKIFETIKNGDSRQYCFNCVPTSSDVTVRTKNKRQAIKKQGIKQLGGCCWHCGEDRFYLLDFHHMEKDEKEHRISNLVMKADTVNFFNEITKCALLCGNCHREFHWLEYNENNFISENYFKFGVDINVSEINRIKIKKDRTCQNCGKELSLGNHSFCKNCLTTLFISGKDGIRKPTIFELNEELKTNKVKDIAIKYGVSQKTVYKWLKR